VRRILAILSPSTEGRDELRCGAVRIAPA
jgi:hypothetical protein